MKTISSRFDAFDRWLIACLAVAFIGMAAMVYEGRIRLAPVPPSPAVTLTDGEYAALRDQRLNYYARLQEKREAEWLRGQSIAAVVTE